MGKSYFYSYDNNGNITAKEYCSFTTGSHALGTGSVTSYSYSKDKMTAYGNESCTYDSVGNPTVYRGKTATWTRGRKLAAYNGTTFSYDAQGRRISKNSITYTYDSNGRILKQSNGFEFFYDTTGLVGLTYNGTPYVYRKDIQGNIIAILDSAGTAVVQYKYDAWGNHTVSGSNITLGNLNPFRYRSYYYDTETKLYFLQSRYYDPEVGRFLNMDSVFYADLETVNGLNLYAYCCNDPINFYDPTGNFVISVGLTLMGIGLGAALLGWLEFTYHPIQNTVEAIGDAVADIFDDIQVNNQVNNYISSSGDLLDINLSVSEIEELISNIMFAKSYNPDPFARPGQHKQGLENKNKSRKKPGWEPRSGRRRPKPPNKHTPGRDHKHRNFELINLLINIWY